MACEKEILLWGIIDKEESAYQLRKTFNNC